MTITQGFNRGVVALRRSLEQGVGMQLQRSDCSLCVWTIRGRALYVVVASGIIALHILVKVGHPGLVALVLGDNVVVKYYVKVIARVGQTDRVGWKKVSDGFERF
jgi:hypothetical protein